MDWTREDLERYLFSDFVLDSPTQSAEACEVTPSLTSASSSVSERIDSFDAIIKAKDHTALLQKLEIETAEKYGSCARDHTQNTNGPRKTTLCLHG